MIPAGLVLADVARTLVALLAGYLVGSVPVSAWLGRRAGVDVRREGEANPGSANVWRLAGPGWGLLALAGDLAKGVLPVAIGIVTIGWWTGWLAGIGAVVGAAWPGFGRLGGGRAVATLGGACVALAPAAGLVGLGLAGLVAAGARAIGRNGRVAAIALGFGAFPLLFLVEHADLARLAGVGILYGVAVTRYASTRPPSARR